jgi:hypothetical protein
MQKNAIVVVEKKGVCVCVCVCVCITYYICIHTHTQSNKNNKQRMPMTGFLPSVGVALRWAWIGSEVRWRMLTYAGVCWRMLTYADVC